MQQQFKFRHASSLAGAFVLLTLLLLGAGVFLAGRARGWLEGTFTLRTRFDPARGALGLQEGNEVRVWNTVAGKVTRMMPTDEGTMEATLAIRRRFAPVVSSEAVAKVKKTLGVAGDAFIEIETGSGPPVEEDALIPLVTDEDLLNTVQRVVNEVESAVRPVAKKAENLVSHANDILAAVNEGEGVAGALVRDEQFALNVKQAAVEANRLMRTSEETVMEVQRLVRGMQQHWLVRRYIPGDTGTPLLTFPELPPPDHEEAVKRLQLDLDRARKANRSEGVIRNAYNLALLGFSSDRNHVPADALIAEIRQEAGHWKHSETLIRLLEAEQAHSSGDSDKAVRLAREGERRLSWSADHEVEMLCWFRLARLTTQGGQQDQAQYWTSKAERVARKLERRIVVAECEICHGTRLLHRQPASAAERFDSAAETFRKLGDWLRMAQALGQAGDAYARADRPQAAVDRYFRAGRTLTVLEHDAARQYLKRGRELAVAAGLNGSVSLIRRLEDKAM